MTILEVTTQDLHLAVGRLTAENELRRNEHLETCKLVDKLTAERDTLQNKVYDLAHVIQHWEVDAEGLKDDIEELTAERDAAVRELNAIRGEHTPGEAYTLANPRPSLAGLVAENLAGCRAENEQLRAKLDIATKELLYINNCSGTQIQDACHACRTDNDRLRAELARTTGGRMRDLLTDAEELCAKRSQQLTELREAAAACVDNAHSLNDDCYHVYAPMVDALEAVLAKTALALT